jgi:tRNA threonylcarbamoyladenosine biosynthesis protein TsaB
MLILNIETTTNVGSVSLSLKGKTWIMREDYSGDHAKNLTLFINEIITTANIKLEDIDAVSISEGPGSYTGLRIGVSIAKGICYTLNKPLIAVNTLKSLAYAVKLLNPVSENDLIIPVMDARRMDAYAAVYSANLDSLKEPFFLSLTENTFEELSKNGSKIWICGNASEKFQAISKGNFTFSKIHLCSSRFLENLALKSFYSSKFEDIAYYEPFYLKPPNITTPKIKT